MAYIGKSPTGTGVRQRYYFTATGGETSLSGADDHGLTLSFSDGVYVDVSLNGISLVAGDDYNTSTANTIGGLTALAANDVVEIVVYDIFTVADTVSAKDGGTFSGNVAMAGNELILDADGDTSLHADTDDQIDVKVAGSDVAAFKSDGLHVDSTKLFMPNLSTNAFYRTGTWSPKFTNTSSQDVFNAPHVSDGKWVRIGDYVWVQGHIENNNSISTTSNYGANDATEVTELPFTAITDGSVGGYTGFQIGWFHNWTSWSSGYTPMGHIIPNTKRVRLKHAVANGTSNIAQLYLNSNRAGIIFSMGYVTDDA